MIHERFVQSFDGTELYVDVVGEGIPLVLCDGIGCDGYIWRYFRDYFRDRFKLVHMHYRGHGLSRAPADFSSLEVETLQRDLLHVLDALELDRVVLVGHSMGCQVALDFALTHPERVLGLVPICGSYGRPLDTFHDNALLASVFPFMHEAVQRWPSYAQRLWQRIARSELAYQVAVHVEVNGKLVRRDDFAPYFEHMAGMDVRVFARLLDSVGRHSVEDRLPELACPTLIVAGERDSFTPAWLSRRMFELIPGAELLVMPGGTHIAALEIPELLHLRVDRFLAERVSIPAVSTPAPTRLPRVPRGQKTAEQPGAAAATPKRRKKRGV